jgi:D-cysteine desulfhydrase
VGLDCDLLFPGARPSVPSVNVELAREAGAGLLFGVVETREELDDAVLDHANRLYADGRRPYPLPRGGATAVGAIGYAYAARELAEQCNRAGIQPETVVVATGSGGTQAGLVAGRVGFGLGWQLIGASVSRPAAPLADQILQISQDCAAILDLKTPAIDDVDVRDCRGAGFGVASQEDRVSARLALRHESLLLDDYYGAKAMTLFRSLLAADAPTPAVFWHTGGVAAALTALTRGAP